MLENPLPHTCTFLIVDLKLIHLEYCHFLLHEIIQWIHWYEQNELCFNIELSVEVQHVVNNTTDVQFYYLSFNGDMYAMKLNAYHFSILRFSFTFNSSNVIVSVLWILLTVTNTYWDYCIRLLFYIKICAQFHPESVTFTTIQDREHMSKWSFDCAAYK